VCSGGQQINIVEKSILNRIDVIRGKEFRIEPIDPSLPLCSAVH
jgi:hypothetical protein